jgi:hypothetical protein
VLAVGALLWLAAVAAAVVPLVDEDVPSGRLEARPLPRTTCAGPMLGVHSTLAYTRGGGRRAGIVGAVDKLLRPQVVRDTLLWHEIEPKEGKRNWGRLDSVVEELRAAGIEPLLVVLGSPSWANDAPQSPRDGYLHVPARGPALDAWLDRYSQFLGEAVRRYRRFVRRWEIWNEPNMAAFWRPRPDPVAYLRVYERLRAVILRADPKAQVAVGGLASLAVAPQPDISGLAFLRRLTRTRPPIDNVAVHAYTTNEHPPEVHIPGEKNFDDIKRVHDQLITEGVRASIWVTEWGWSSAAVGERRQARYVDRSLRMLEARYPFVRVATYFADHDRPPEFFQGLLHERLEPKPAARAFRRHADLAASRCSRSGP